MKRAARHQRNVRPDSREPEFNRLRGEGIDPASAGQRLCLSDRTTSLYEARRRAELSGSVQEAVGVTLHDQHVAAILAKAPDGWRGFERIAA